MAAAARARRVADDTAFEDPMLKTAPPSAPSADLAPGSIAAKIAQLAGVARVVLTRTAIGALDKVRELRAPRTVEEADRVGKALIYVKTTRAEIQKHWADIKRPLNDARNVALEQEKLDLAPWEAHEKRLGDYVAAWTREQQAIAERERKRLQDEADARARAEAEAKAAELLRAAEAESNPALKNAIATEAHAIATAPVVAEKVTGPVAHKPAGLAVPRTYKAEVTDLMKLIKAVAAGKAPITLITVNQVVLDGLAKNTEGQINLPGVRCYAVDSTRSVGGRK